MQQKKGLFITLEGVEGVGKSTAVRHIVELFHQRKKEILVTREPGGTEIAETIRQVLLRPHEEMMVADTELLLIFAGRAQHIANVIQPNLLAGKHVLSDRFTDATYAYQGGGRGVALSRIKAIEDWVQKGLKPDLTLLLDAPIEVGLNRIAVRGKKDRIEQEAIEFFERVRETYLHLAALEPNRIRIVDATGTQEEVNIKLEEIIDSLGEAIE